MSQAVVVGTQALHLWDGRTMCCSLHDGTSSGNVHMCAPLQVGCVRALGSGAAVAQLGRAAPLPLCMLRTKRNVQH